MNDIYLSDIFLLLQRAHKGTAILGKCQRKTAKDLAESQKSSTFVGEKVNKTDKLVSQENTNTQ